MDKLIEKANILMEALPYIQKYEGETFVIKYGGNAMIDESLKQKVIQDIILLKLVGINPILIHGGGPELTNWLQKVNKESVFVDGLRVTDEETVELAEMVFVGKINKSIVSLIHKHGGKAAGLSGRDGKLIVAEKKVSANNKDIGFVGNVKKINVEILQTLIDSGFLPVISSIGEDETGQNYNINADSVAGAIAISLKASKLFLLTDIDGVYKDDDLVSKLSPTGADDLIKQGVIKGGMIPKIQCAVQAVEQGIEKAHIINGQIEHSMILEIFTDHGIGTMIRK